MQIPGVQFFELEELVDKPFIDRFGGHAIGLLPIPLVLCLDRLRKAAGPLKINDWHSGGSFHESGLRVPWTTTGAPLSMHKMRLAFDLKPTAISVNELYDHIMHFAALYPEIRRIENPLKTITWLHVDGFPHPGDGIQTVEPA